MKKTSAALLQVVIVLIGIATLFILIRFPMTEGRAKDLDLFSIYADPFILYGYASSIAFFIGLYKVFRLLGYIRHNELVSINSINALRSIRYCAIALSILIVMAGMYIKLFHNKDDDPAGFLAMCIVTTFISVAVAIVALVFERKLQNAIDEEVMNTLLHRH